MSEAQETMVRYETDEKVGIITLDRASKLNAINAAMKEQIIAAFARADKDPATSVIVLRAEGRSFSRRLRHRRRRRIAARTAAPPIPTPGIRSCTAASTSASRPGRPPSR